MAFNPLYRCHHACRQIRGIPGTNFPVVVAPADDHGINIADVAIGEIELTLFRASRSTRFVALGLTGVRFRSGQTPSKDG
jgi:hypothetical protein